MTTLFLCRSFFVSTTCALHGKLLDSIIPLGSKRSASSATKLPFLARRRRDFVIMGLQLESRFSKSRVGDTFSADGSSQKRLIVQNTL